MFLYKISEIKLVMRWLSNGLLLVSLMATLPVNAASLGLKPLAEVVVYPQYELPAEVISQNDSQLSAEINAKIERILVRPGETVKAGQLLIELDCRDYHLQLARVQASMQENQASLDFALAQRSRFQRLQTQSLASASQLEDISADYARRLATSSDLKVQKKQAEQQIERCQIKSPFQGVVQAQLIGVGALARVGSPLLNLVQTEAAEIKVTIPLSLSGDLQQLPARFKAVGIDEVSVNLLRISAAIDTQTRSVTAWYHSAMPLRIGLAGNLIVKDSTPHLPANLLVKRGEQLGFFIRSNEHAKFIPLPMAQEGRSNILFPAMYDAKMVVITEGFQRLSNGETLP
jgi:RND family efflux transporter MFP subunit